jgi:hypothetical protein
MVFVSRARAGRIIGLRRANRREISQYVRVIKQIKLKMPTLEEDQLITVSAQSDPDALSLAEEQMNAMVPMRTMEPRGTQPSGHCVAL